MTSPITGSPIFGPTPFTGGGTDKLGQEEFLRLLVSQLKYQDPLNPMEGSEFAVQLAQFSSVEQLIALNKGLEAQAATDALSAITIKTSLAASLMGKDVVAIGNGLTVGSDGMVNAEVEIGGAGTAVLKVYDSGGGEVASADLGMVSKGRQTLTWDSGGSLPPGDYTYSVEVTSATGDSVPLNTYVRGVIDGLYFLDGAIILKSGSLDIPMDRLVEITPAAGTASG